MVTSTNARKENNNVIGYLNYYFYEDINSDYAVLLNGPWGSGKTYFIKNKFFKEDHELTKPLYITLNGLTSISEITDQFFSQLHPKLSSKAFRMLGVIASRAINGYAGTEVAKDENDKSIVKDIFLNIKNRIIIFDDLERCLIPIQSILGYINAFVEHDGCKVLVVASESDIPEDQREDYLLKKEKTIGKTISLIPSVGEVIDFFCDTIKNNLAKESILKNKKDILKIINDSGSVNFRSVRAIFGDFERLVVNFESYLNKSTVAIKKLLTSMLALGIEHRRGNISSEEIENIPTNSFTYSLTKSSPGKIDIIIGKYSTVDWFDPILPYDSIAKVFSVGVMDIDNIATHLSQHPLLSVDKYSYFWRDLWSWTDLTRSKYLIALNGLKGQLEKYEIVEPEVILHVVGIVLSLEMKNEKSLTLGVDVVSYFKKYVRNLLGKGLLLPDIEFFSELHSSKYNLGFICSDKEEFTIIKEYLSVAVNDSFYSLRKKSYPDFLFSLFKNSMEYSRLYEYGISEGNYGGVPFLHLIPPGYFSHMIINDWKCNRTLLASLSTRYSRDLHSKKLVDEYIWLKKLMKMTYRVANNAEEPQKIQLISDLGYYFGKIEEKI